MSHIRGADLVFIMDVQNERVLKSVWEECEGIEFNDVKALRAYAHKATENFGTLVVDNTTAGTKGAPVKRSGAV